MALEKESFVFYRSFFEAIKAIKDKDRLKIYDAICEFALNEKETELTGITKGIFEMAKPIIVSSRNRYNACVENGKKGGRPKKEKPNNNLIGFENQKPKQNLNENDNENVNDNDNNNASESCVDGLQEVIDFYNNNIGFLTPFGLEILTEYTKKLNYEMVIYAMQISVEANKRTIQYIKAILNNWIKAGIKTLVEAKKESEKKNISAEEEFLNE